ncbi:MAG: hypothetical protein ACLP29_00720 [Dissulfurispiraceae bacterium]
MKIAVTDNEGFVLGEYRDSQYGDIDEMMEDVKEDVRLFAKQGK